MRERERERKVVEVSKVRREREKKTKTIDFFFDKQNNLYLCVREERDQFGPGPLLAQGQRDCREPAHGVEAEGDVLVLELVTVFFLIWKRKGGGVSIESIFFFSVVAALVATETAAKELRRNSFNAH